MQLPHEHLHTQHSGIFYRQSSECHCKGCSSERNDRCLRCAKQVRIVEIGSGSGGTSAPVMAALQAADGGALQQHIDFLYTDISAQLVGYGRRTYGATYSFARFKVCGVPHYHRVVLADVVIETRQ